jgi:hypothetical protein
MNAVMNCQRSGWRVARKNFGLHTRKSKSLHAAQHLLLYRVFAHSEIRNFSDFRLFRNIGLLGGNILQISTVIGLAVGRVLRPECRGILKVRILRGRDGIV